MPATLSRDTPAAAPLISEIESALKEGSGERRMRVLMQVTDLFISHAESIPSTGMFDDVLNHLIAQVENSALIELSRRLAPLPNAPQRTLRSLARNDSIAVAGPILENSTQLSDAELVEIANSKSQWHLSSIATRANISEAVTEALVDRGDAEVANKLAGNPGARFSRMTMDKLALRADGDDRLTGALVGRPDIPPAVFRNLIMQATEAVREKLLAGAAPAQKATIRQVLDQIAAQTIDRGKPKNYDFAERVLATFSQDTELCKQKVREFAAKKRIAELIATLGFLSAVEVEDVEALFYTPGYMGLMVLCKTVQLNWDTLYAVLTARPDAPAKHEFPYMDVHEQYRQLSMQSAQQLLRFWVGRRKIAGKF